jgi:iron(III) transport system substrate-binding protein
MRGNWTKKTSRTAANENRGAAKAKRGTVTSASAIGTKVKPQITTAHRMCATSHGARRAFVFEDARSIGPTEGCIPGPLRARRSYPAVRVAGAQLRRSLNCRVSPAGNSVRPRHPGSTKPRVAPFALAPLVVASGAARAQGQFTVICSVPAPLCEAVAASFLKDTGIKVALSLRSSGEAMAQVAAEKANPKTDVWYTGTGDPHLQAAELGLTEEYRSPMLPQLHDWAVRQAEQSKYRTVGVYSGALGIAFNTELLAKKKLPEPRCWADLANPIYRDEVQMANPNASGTAYATLATFVQIFGEDKAFELMKGMHRNTNNYPRAGAGSGRAAARGETAIAVTFLHDGVTEIANGFPIKLVVPCEGTGYEVGSMSIVKGARNLDNAKKFYDWALTPAAQALGAQTKNFQTPSNKSTPIPPQAPRLGDLKLIDYDFAKYGSAAERKRILEKWDKEVYAIPR